MLIIPHHEHMHRSPLQMTGPAVPRVVGFDDIQGTDTAGTQGAGVKTPEAAAVAAITAGLVGALHTPKGAILTIGKQSDDVAIGRPQANREPVGTVRVAGICPNVHEHNAPETTTGTSLL
jgi:hypothetical protein